MGRRQGRKQTLRMKKRQTAAAGIVEPDIEQDVAAGRIVLVGRRTPGEPPRLRVDFTAFSDFGAEVVEEMAGRLGIDAPRIQQVMKGSSI